MHTNVILVSSVRTIIDASKSWANREYDFIRRTRKTFTPDITSAVFALQRCYSHGMFRFFLQVMYTVSSKEPDSQCTRATAFSHNAFSIIFAAWDTMLISVRGNASNILNGTNLLSNGISGRLNVTWKFLVAASKMVVPLCDSKTHSKQIITHKRKNRNICLLNK